MPHCAQLILMIFHKTSKSNMEMDAHSLLAQVFLIEIRLPVAIKKTRKRVFYGTVCVIQIDELEQIFDEDSEGNCEGENSLNR